MERMRNKDLENAWAVQGIRQEKCAKLEEENKKLKECNKSQSEVINNVFIPQKERLEEENKKLKERIDVLYEFIERNDKLVDEVIALEDLDKLNRYICIDDDLVDKALESED